MNLSSELISQFVKVTNDSNNEVEETTVYGTIVEFEGTKYVRLDGSELLTPITTSANVKPGERVTVMIKNHTATVTGNLSSPAARIDDIVDTDTILTKISEVEILVAGKVDTEDFVAEQGRIDELIAKDAEITGSLEAAEADIDILQSGHLTVTERLDAVEADIDALVVGSIDVSVLDAKYAKIESLEATDTNLHNLESTYAAFEVATTEKLTAVEADIDDLTADKLSVTNAEAMYAKIVDLDATNAVVDNLGADVAEIDTLIFGSASGSTIQSSFANAVIAQLGDAQINSAMIKDVSAGKITSGDILTSKVRILSDDGRLYIAGNTIQIRDKTRVRVQIGKDSSNDYSISIWDVDGNLMFSKGGITDSAIKSAIIRNDMVSDTANIAAYKLDIDSLFEEINGSTNTIKSTRVFLDDEGQTLDVAFKELKTETTELDSTVSSQGTEISAIQGQITSKVWQQDIDTATGEMDTRYSTLQQEVDSVTATIASHTTELSNKADKTSVTEVRDQVSTLEADLSGFKTTVSDTYATQTDMKKAQTDIAQNSDSITAVSERTTTNESSISSLELTADGLSTRVTSNEDELAVTQSSADLIEARVTTAETLIEQLSDSIALLVTDSNGESLMTQTTNGWTFSTAQLQSAVDTTSENLDSLTNAMGDVNSTVSALQQALDDLGILNDYVKIGIYESEPCIKLGESDSDFKLLITNTRIMFMEGSGVPAYINNQSLFIKKAVIEEELQQGEFIWKVRNNGNLGLIWKGVSS